VYGIVALLVWWEFASWRVALCIMIPLYITSVIGEAIMAQLGLGVKVATMPVIALGVGIGVDYGIYIYNKIDNYLDAGLPFKEAYLQTLQTTGAAVALTAIMLAIGVFTWVFSTIKFQADMGLLLVFMFIWNMVGAIILLPVLARYLVPAANGSTRRIPVAQVDLSATLDKPTSRFIGWEETARDHPLLRYFCALFDLSGRSAIVTGSGSGSGRATAISLAGLGAQVWATDIDADASKGAVKKLSKAVAVELAPQGIRVNSIHPGPTQTNLAANHEPPRDAEGKPIPPEQLLAAWLRLVPIGRLGTVSDVAPVIAFLCSDAAQYITGAEIVVDGGYTAIWPCLALAETTPLAAAPGHADLKGRFAATGRHIGRRCRARETATTMRRWKSAVTFIS